MEGLSEFKASVQFPVQSSEGSLVDMESRLRYTFDESIRELQRHIFDLQNVLAVAQGEQIAQFYGEYAAIINKAAYYLREAERTFETRVAAKGL